LAESSKPLSPSGGLAKPKAVIPASKIAYFTENSRNGKFGNLRNFEDYEKEDSDRRIYTILIFVVSDKNTGIPVFKSEPKSLFELVDAELIEDEEYKGFGDSAPERVKGLL